MKVIDEQKCHEWFKTNRWEDAFRIASSKDPRWSRVYGLPVDTGRKTALARALSQVLDMQPSGLLWITAWGIFPSSENVTIFDSYRRSLGERRVIHEAPGHVFSPSDRLELECLLCLVLYFYWDASVYEGPGDVAIKVSHDEWIAIFARDEERLTRLETRLEGLQLTRWK